MNRSDIIVTRRAVLSGCKHTPGPWQGEYVDTTHALIADRSGDKFLLELVAEDPHGHLEISPIRREHNLKLAMNAPHLLEVAVEALLVLQDEPLAGHVCSPEQRAQQKDMIARLSMAISQATGGAVDL